MAYCPSCGKPGVGLKHLSCECPLNDELRSGIGEGEGRPLLEWALQGTTEIAVLAEKEKFVGLSVARMANSVAMASRGPSTP